MPAPELNNQAAKITSICSNNLCISKLGFLGLQIADHVSYLIRKTPYKKLFWKLEITCAIGEEEEKWSLMYLAADF